MKRTHAALAGLLGAGMLWTGLVQAQALASSNVLAAPAAAPLSMSAAEGEDLPQALARQRQQLSAQREAILGIYAHEKKACWQKFAVNACLTEARRVRRQQLNPIHQQELTLNAQERLWRTEQRNLRLQNKTHAPEDPA